MKKYLVLGGYGGMGSIAVLDLFKTTKDEIIVAGRDAKKAKQFASKFKSKRVKYTKADANNIIELISVFKKIDTVVNCAQYYVNLNVMRACLKAKCNYLDLGGLFHMTLKQLKLHNKFKKKKLIAILGCGSTPGITNILAKYGANQLDKVYEIHISFASYDYLEKKDSFIIPYSAYTLFDEFTDKPALFTKGKLIFVSPMSGKDKEIFPPPVGIVNSFYTLHSELATFPNSFKKKGLRECSFKVTFPDKFVEQIKFLINIGLGSKKSIIFNNQKISLRDIVAKELNRFIPNEIKKVNDIEYIRVYLKGIKNKKEIILILDCLAKSDPETNLSAGSVDTGVPPSIIAQMIENKKIKSYGVLPPEKCIDQIYFFKEIKKRNMEIYEEKRWKI